MAYYSGSAVNMAGVRQALVDACSLEGWAWNASTEMLSKGAMFLRLQVVSGYLTALGRTSAAAGDAPGVVRIGWIAPMRIADISWPVEYEIFVFEDEVYLVINYAVDYYQWLAFGQSSISGVSGTGLWVSATLSHVAMLRSDIEPIDMAATDGGGSNLVCPGIFWGTTGQDQSRQSWVHSDIDGQGWWPAQSLAGAPVGISASAPLLGLLPNAWNSEAVLLPIRAYKVRPSSKVSLTAELAHARYTRIDNYVPKEVVQIGSDKWRIFPFYRKNSAARNGGAGINHSGTFGWAIRYEGP